MVGMTRREMGGKKTHSKYLEINNTRAEMGSIWDELPADLTLQKKMLGNLKTQQ